MSDVVPFVHLAANDTDPYLTYRPKFAFSQPVQVLLQGITFTLTTVLVFHLLFTTQYHYPLSQANYGLQLTGLIVVWAAVVGTLCLVLLDPSLTAEQWPYMLDYIAVTVPPNDWGLVAQAFWYLLLACANFVVHLAHIQFLTLLYPSALEVKLITILLGPLSLLASGLTFTALSDNQTVNDLGDAIRNVFNGTLLLVFCISLILWGCLVNRKRAWRMDGGTALFGIGAMGLAVASTAMNFVAVGEDGLTWFQNLIWATVLWQSWLGFWWWVGSGMGIGEVEDIVEREEKKRLKEQNRKQRKKRKGKAGLKMPRTSTGNSAAKEGTASSSALSQFIDVWRTSGNTLTRRRASVPDEIELQDLDRTTGTGPSIAQSPRLGTASQRRGSLESSSAVQNGRAPSRSAAGGLPGTSSSSTVSGTPLESVSGILGYPINFVLRWMRFLRLTHEKATTEKVIERVTRRNKAFERNNLNENKNGERTPSTPRRNTGEGLTRTDLGLIAQGNSQATGWGLGRRGVTEAQEGLRRMEEARRIQRGERLLRPEEETVRGGRWEENDQEDEELADVSDIERGEGPSRPRQARFESEAERERVLAAMMQEIKDERAEDGPVDRTVGRLNANDEWIDEETIGPDGRPISRSRKTSKRGRGRRRGGGGGGGGETTAGGRAGAPAPELDGAQTGWTWWGPLRKWRLADRTTY